MSQVISCVEFLSLVIGANNGHFKSIDVYNDVKLKGGKKCPVYGAKKRQTVLGRMGQAYDSLIKKACEEAGVDPSTYQKGEMPFGVKVNPNVITHTLASGERMVYLVFVGQTYTDPVYYACNGQELSTSDVTPWLAPSSLWKPETTEGVELKLKGRYTPYRLDSIEGCHMDGVDYAIDHSDIGQAVAMF
jgi:hypothetical protein